MLHSDPTSGLPENSDAIWVVVLNAAVCEVWTHYCLSLTWMLMYLECVDIDGALKNQQHGWALKKYQGMNLYKLHLLQALHSGI